MNPMTPTSTGPNPPKKKKKKGKKVSSAPTPLHLLKGRNKPRRHGSPPFKHQYPYPHTQHPAGAYYHPNQCPQEPPIQPAPPPGFITMHVKVPVGLSPHRMMIVNTNFGYPVTLIVPSGLPPGAIFAVFVPSPTNTKSMPPPHRPPPPSPEPAPPPFTAAQASGMLPPPHNPPPPPSMIYCHPQHPIGRWESRGNGVVVGRHWEICGNDVVAGYQDYGPQYSYY